MSHRYYRCDINDVSRKNKTIPIIWKINLGCNEIFYKFPHTEWSAWEVEPSGHEEWNDLIERYGPMVELTETELFLEMV